MLGYRGPAISARREDRGVDSRIALGPFSLMSVKHLVGHVPRPIISTVHMID
jgi:hypothetical protein